MHMDLYHIHEREEGPIGVRKCDERFKESCPIARRVTTTHNPRPQCGLGNLQVVRHLGNAVGGKFAYIFVCVEVRTFLAHRSLTIEY